MDRREFALGAGALLAAGGFGGSALAYDDAISSRARALHRRAIVVDANLGPPLTSDQLPLAQATLDLARNAGVSASKPAWAASTRRSKTRLRRSRSISA